MVGGSKWCSREEESANASFLPQVAVDPADDVVDEDSALQGEVGACPQPVQLHQRHVEDRLRLWPAGHLPHAADPHRTLVFLQTNLIVVMFPLHSVTQHESVERKQNQFSCSGKEDLTCSESRVISSSLYMSQLLVSKSSDFLIISRFMKISDVSQDKWHIFISNTNIWFSYVFLLPPAYQRKIKQTVRDHRMS